MNDERLIELVRACPVLYDQSNHRYTDSNFKNSVWRKIGAEMKRDWSSCKVRWGNIRDNFRKSLHKQKTKRGQKAKNVKSYKYSQQLQFLVKFFEERETIANLEEEVTNQDPSDEEQEELSERVHPESEEIGQDCTAAAEDPSEKVSTSNTTGSENIPRKKIRLTNDSTLKTAAATLMEYIVKSNQSQSVPFPQQDPVDAFLAGIAPVLKRLPPKDWFYAKGEIFDIVQKYEFNVLINHQSANETRSGGYSTPSQSDDEQLSHTGRHQSTSQGCLQSTPCGRSVKDDTRSARCKNVSATSPNK